MNSKPVNASQSSTKDDDIINLLGPAIAIWVKRKTILRSMLLAGLIGVFIAFFSPKEYNAWTTIVPQTSQSSSRMGGLSSLAALAGFNVDLTGSSTTMSPLIYPQILKSAKFQLELINTPFTFSEVDHRVTLLEYYTKIARPGVLESVRKYTIGLPGLIIGAFKEGPSENKQDNSGGPISLTNEQEGVMKSTAGKIELTLDPERGCFTLEAAFHEPLLTAQVVERSIELLQKSIIRYKTDKAMDQLSFIEGRYEEKKKDFLKAQEQLARFRDQNKNVSSAMVRSEEERLQLEYSLSMTVFNELAKQLEQARIKVKEETPVFSVIEPTVVPSVKSKPKKVIILSAWLAIGAILGIGIVFGKDYILELRANWKKQLHDSAKT